MLTKRAFVMYYEKMCFYDAPSYYTYSTSCGRNDQNMGK